MNRTRVHPRNIRRTVLASAIACCFAPGFALANPVGPAVAHGQASFNTQGKLLTVTNSPGTIINWKGFSIGAGETTRFVQQNAASAVLNRVVGKDASAIFGALQSNGRVFLINPNGILFGAGAQIDTAGLVASTLNMLDADFITGRLRFGDTPGAKSISNEGEIRTPIGGRVLLVSPEGVENSGIITSPKGEVILAAGKSVEITDSANPEVRVEVSAPEARAVNLGKIVAESGKVGIYGGIVANRGLVSADSAVVNENGKVVFKATREARLEAGSETSAKGGSAVVAENGRVIFKASGAAGSDTGSENAARAVVSDNGRIVFQATGETNRESGSANGASAVVSDNGRIVFQAARGTSVQIPDETTGLDAGRITSSASGDRAVGAGGKIVIKATHEASLDAGSVTSANGASGGSIEVSAGNGTTLVAGSVQATGSAEAGGEVRLLGERVGLIGSGSIDVSGERGGGTALVGGDLQGANAAVQNAQMTYFGPNASIKADAITAGDGGKVIVWADDTTRSYGAISARGGNTGGNGGFVETSGKLGLIVRRGPDLRAPAGKPGTWLLDPNDLDLVAGEVFDPATNTGSPFFAPLADSSQVGVDLINAQLDFGSDVILTTTSRGATEGTQQGNITIRAPIVKSAESSGDVFIGTTRLTMQADNNIVIAPGGSIVSVGDPLDVLLQANFAGTGSGGVTIGGPIVTNGGFFSASGKDLIAVNAPISTLNSGGSFGGTVQFNSTASGVSLAAPISGGFVSVFGQGGSVNVAANIASTSSVSLTGKTGVSVAPGTTIATGPFSGFSATASDPGALLDIGAGATIASRGATLTADNMNIQGMVNAADGTITVRQSTASRPINLGTEVGSALSITQLEFDNLETTGSFFLGNSASGAITVAGTISGSPSFVSVSSGTSYTQNAGVSLSSSLQINAPTIAIAAPLTAAGASGITLTTDTLTVSNPVTASGGNLDINARTFGRQISLGIGSPTGTALELTDAQIDLLNSPNRLRFSTSGPINIAGLVSPAGATTLSLASSNNSVTQASGATITVPSLAVSARTLIDLPEHNNVDNFAAQIVCCSAGDINFVAQASKLVNITTVDGISGVTVNNFSGTGNIMLQADDLNVTSLVRANIGNVKLMPETATRVVTLGGDVAGTLSLNNTESGFIQGTHVTISGDTINIPGAVAFASPTTVLSPFTIDRAVKVVGSKTGTALELLPSELNNITGATVVLGGANAGPVSVETTTAIPSTIGKFVLHSGGSAPATTSSVTVGLSTPLTATNSIGITADNVSLQSAFSSSGGNIEIATHTASRKIDIGADPGGSLGFGTPEIGFLSASAGTISFTTAGGDIDVTGATFGAAASVSFDAGGTFRLLSAGTLSSPGSLAVRAPTLDIQGMTSMSTGATGNLTLVGNTFTINSSGTSITSAGDINIMPRDFRSIDLGGVGSGSTIGLDNSELGTMTPTGELRIGETSGFTGNINLSAAISLPGRTVSLKTGSGNISQGTGATLTAASLAAEASGAITLNESNVVNTIALSSDFSSIGFTRAPGGTLTVGAVDDLVGIVAGTFSRTPVTLRADQINVDQNIFGSTVTLLPTAGTSIDIGTRSGFGFTQADFDRISATSLVTIGEAASDDLTVSAPINITSFNNLTLVTGNAAAMGSAITVPGNLSITANSMTVPAALTSTGGDVALVTDSLDVTGTVSAFNAIGVRPLTGTRHIDLGTETGGKLSVTDAEVDKLSAPILRFGATPRIDITAAITPLPAVQTIELITDDLTIPGAGSLTVPNLSVSTVTSGRTIDLGTSGVGTFMGLDAATLAKLSIADSLIFTAPGASTITVSAAGLTIPAPDLSLSARTININESLAASRDIALRADLPLNIAATKTVTAGTGDIQIAPRSGSMTFGAGGLIDSTKLTQLVSGSGLGFLELGDSNTTSLSIAQPLNASPFGGLGLTANGNISQTTGSIITADQLLVQSNSGTVSLTENNVVGILAGSAGLFNNFRFTNAGALTIGTVDGVAGVGASSGTVELRADSLTITDSVFANTVTLAPRVAGTAIDVGSDTGFGLTDAELDRVSAFTLNVGTSGTNPSGPITVSAPVDYAGNLNLVTAAGSSIAVAAALGSASSGAISMNAGAGGTVGIAGAVHSSSTINVIADTITTSQPITSEFSSVSLSNVGTSGSVTIGGDVNARFGVSVTGKTIAVNGALTTTFGSVNLTAPTGSTGSSTTVNAAVKAGSSINITTDNLAINAPLESGSSVTLAPRTTGTPVSLGGDTSGFSVNTTELGLIETSQLTVGSSSAGDLEINVPIGPFTYSSLVLRSGGDVTQTPGSTITVRTGDPEDPPSIAGSLSVFSAGKINLPEANDVAISVSGVASGPGNDFVFNNITPLKLQNVSGVSPNGKVLVRTATPTPSSGDTAPETLINAVLSDILKAADQDSGIDKRAEERKDEAEKREREEQKKKGTPSCS